MSTTARILFDKAFGNSSSQSCQACVDWAVQMLGQGHDGNCLAMLASMSSPFNDFEIAEYRDRSLVELQINEVSKVEAATIYAVELSQSAYVGQINLMSALYELKGICIECNYAENWYDFYLLYFAYSDLQSSEVQWYWEGANRSNIESIIRDRIHSFLMTAGKA